MLHFAALLTCVMCSNVHYWARNEVAAPKSQKRDEIRQPANPVSSDRRTRARAECEPLTFVPRANGRAPKPALRSLSATCWYRAALTLKKRKVPQHEKPAQTQHIPKIPAAQT